MYIPLIPRFRYRDHHSHHHVCAALASGRLASVRVLRMRKRQRREFIQRFLPSSTYFFAILVETKIGVHLDVRVEIQVDVQVEVQSDCKLRSMLRMFMVIKFNGIQDLYVRN